MAYSRKYSVHLKKYPTNSQQMIQISSFYHFPRQCGDNVHMWRMMECIRFTIPYSFFFFCHSTYLALLRYYVTIIKFIHQPNGSRKMASFPFPIVCFIILFVISFQFFSSLLFFICIVVRMSQMSFGFGWFSMSGGKKYRFTVASNSKIHLNVNFEL